MAANKKIVTKKTDYTHIHKLKAAVSLLAFVVILAAGLQAQVSMGTILWRSTLVVLVIMVVSRIIIQLLITHEEMNGGEG